MTDEGNDLNAMSGRQNADAGSNAMSPYKVLQDHYHELVPYEQEEILGYSEVYYWGSRAPKKTSASADAPHNFGYDDKRGDYKVAIRDHLLYRYEVLTKLGSGSFGQVAECRDHKDDSKVAVKIIRNKRRFHKQAKVEVQLLTTLQENDPQGLSNVIPVHNNFTFREHLCIVFPLASLNLYELIKKYKFRGFNLSLVVKFAAQMLTTLCFMRSLNIVHCDLKPENVLLRYPNRYSLWVIDFGSGCFESQRKYSYIQSRFYRAPEVILGLSYGMGIDMWSFALILVEIFTGYPLFPGQDESEQLACIMEVFGPPPLQMRESCKRRTQFFDSNLQPFIRPNPQGRYRFPSSTTLEELSGCSDGNFLSFIRGCLEWDPTERLTPEKAREHPWIQEAPVHLLRTVERAASALADSNQPSEDTPDENRPAAQSTKNEGKLTTAQVPPLQLKPLVHRTVNQRVGGQQDSPSNKKSVESSPRRGEESSQISQRTSDDEHGSARGLGPRNVIAAAKEDVARNEAQERFPRKHNRARELHSPIQQAHQADAALSGRSSKPTSGRNGLSKDVSPRGISPRIHTHKVSNAREKTDRYPREMEPTAQPLPPPRTSGLPSNNGGTPREARQLSKPTGTTLQKYGGDHLDSGWTLTLKEGREFLAPLSLR
eukprot:gb/GECG01016690.1/.p1 GENE.gb/GECG01016690.1/~~gb/GECG01016690.1/.p1  ORF type:complete len:656 (+),score=71.87 gb/GECG01016690.1/:1-1968(+)